MIWGFIFVSYLSLFCLGLSDNIRGPLYVDILNHFQINNFAGAWIFAGSSIVAFVASLSIRHLYRWMHPFRGLQLSLFIMGVALYLMGSSASFFEYLLSTFLYGLSFGWLGVSQNYLVSVGSTTEHRSQSLSGLHAMYGLASLTSPLVVGLFSSDYFQWSDILRSIAMVPFATFVLSFLFDSKKYFSETKPEFKSVSKEKGFNYKMLKVSFVLGFYVIAEILLGTRLAAYFRVDHGFNLQQSSFYLMYFFSGLFLGRLFFIFYKTKKPTRSILLGSHVLTIIFLALGLTVQPLFLILCGLSMAPFFPLCILLISELFPHEMEKAIAWTQSAQSFLVVLMHLTVGELTDRYGIRMALTLGLLFCGLSVILLLNVNTKLELTNES